MLDCTHITNTTCTTYEICHLSGDTCEYDIVGFWVCVTTVVICAISFLITFWTDVYLSYRSAVSIKFYQALTNFRTQHGYIKLGNILALLYTILAIPEFIITIVCIIGYYTTFPTVAAYIMIVLEWILFAQSIGVGIWVVRTIWLFCKTYHSPYAPIRDETEYDPTLQGYQNV